MLDALKIKTNRVIFLINFLLFLLSYFFYIYLLSETQIKIIYVIKLLIFLLFILFLLMGNFFKNLIFLLPFSLIFKLAINIEYNVYPRVLKQELSTIIIPFKLFNFFILLFGFFLILYFLSGNSLREKIPLTKYLIFYILWAFLSIIWSLKKDYAFFNSFLLLINTLIYFMGYIFLKDKKDLNKFLSILLIFLLINILISFFQYFYPESFLIKFWKIEQVAYYWTQRTRGIFYHSNSFSAFLVLSSIFILSFTLYERNKKIRNSLFLILLLSVLSLIFTLSRSGYLSLFLALILYNFLYLIKRKRVKSLFIYPLFIFLLLIIILFLIKIFLPSIYLRILSIFWGKRDISIWARTLFWEKCIKIFLEKPLTGIGIGQFAFQKISHIHLHAHNVFFNILAELGLPGLLLFLIIIYKIFEFLIKLYLKIESREIYLIIGLLVGWITIIFQLSFDYFFLNAIIDMEIKFFFIYLLLTFLIPGTYLKDYVKG